MGRKEEDKQHLQQLLRNQSVGRPRAKRAVQAKALICRPQELAITGSAVAEAGTGLAGQFGVCVCVCDSTPQSPCRLGKGPSVPEWGRGARRLYGPRRCCPLAGMPCWRPATCVPAGGAPPVGRCLHASAGELAGLPPPGPSHSPSARPVQSSREEPRGNTPLPLLLRKSGAKKGGSEDSLLREGPRLLLPFPKFRESPHQRGSEEHLPTAVPEEAPVARGRGQEGPQR